MSFFFSNWFPHLHLGTVRADTIEGSGRRDIVVSFSGDDVIRTYGGNDYIFSDGGDDVIEAGSGNDQIFAGSGDDLIDAGDGDDDIDAGKGDDMIMGGRGDDDVDGGKGFDTAVYEGGVDDYRIETPRWSWRPVEVVDLANRDRDKLVSIEAIRFEGDDYTLRLDGANNAVLARDDAFSTDEDTALSIGTAELLANDREFDGDTMSVTAVQGTSALGATVTLSGSAVSYDPGSVFDHLAAGQTVSDTFTYTVDDGTGGTDTATVTVEIIGVNDAPEIVSDASAAIDENETAVFAVQASDAEGDAVAYAIGGGDDAALFSIDQTTGVLSFVSAPDFEAPADQDGDNVYQVTVSASDGNGGETLQDVAVTVTDQDETPPVTPRINEFHYDDASTDSGEFVEVRVGKGADVGSLSLVLYNGSGGASYGTHPLAGNLAGSDADYDYYVVNLPVNGIQNGAPDGIALVDGGEVVEFLSYEGSFTASNGPASGMTSTDIGVSEGGSDVEGLSLQRTGDGATDWDAPREQTPGSSNDLPTAPFAGRINEFHYDDASTDEGEFVEVRVAAGSDVSLASLVLYNGNGGASYGTHPLAGTLAGSDADYDYYVVNLPVNGLQNGAPDGIALVNDGQVVEFLSYEGSFTATDGPASGMASTDIGVSEGGSDVEGLSLQRVGDGPTDWDAPRTQTAGAANDAAGTPLVINEIAISTTGTDWEFVELFGEAGTSLDGYSLVQVDGDGDVRSVVDLSGQSIGTNGYFLAASPQAGSTFGVTGDLDIANNTFTNVSSTFLLVQDYSGAGDVDADNDGAVDAGVVASITDSVAIVDDDGPLVYSANVVGPDGTFLAAGAARSAEGSGAFVMTAFGSSAGYTPTAGGGGGTGGDPTAYRISEIQGSGTASLLDSAYVLVSAIVTYTVENGFFLQEEMADQDGSDLTSEGIFVYTGGAPTVDVGDLVEVTGTVDEFFGLTEITDLVSVNTVSSGHALPDLSDVTLPLATADALEQFEGMRISLTSSTSDPITVIENFDLDRYGEITVSAGNQYQPTQIFDPTTQAAEIAALAEANSLNRLVIDDGISSQNPDAFRYIPAATGDNGNGYLDSGDTFGADGPTLRLGAEMDAPVEGVLTYGFDAYRMLVDGTLPVDETTNGEARPEAPASVGGDVVVSSFNLLNFFTTLNDGSGAGSGPNNLEPRGATTAADLERQLDKIVDAMLEIGADVFGLQELENNGFGSTSAIATLVEALNTELGSEVYAFVDPTGGSASGYIGTDAITTGVIYNQTTLDVVGADYLVFSDGPQPLNRPAIAVAFEEIASGETFNVAVNHFKSKGDSGLTDTSNPNYDQGDGQGFWNAARTQAANELAAWLATDPTGSGDPDTLIIGDLNAYAQEDPVDALRDAGYIDLIDTFIGQEDAYSYVFDGQRGTLDQGLATASLAAQVTGLTEWHINADEPDLLGYSSEFNPAGFYDPGVYATSDHDPLVIGLDLGLGLV